MEEQSIKATKTKQDEPLYESIDMKIEKVSESRAMQILRKRLEGATVKQLNHLLSDACLYGSDKWTVKLVEIIIEAGADPHYNNDSVFIGSCGRDAGDDFTIPAYFLNEQCIDLNYNDCGVKALKAALNMSYYVIAQKLLDCGLILTENDVKKFISNAESDEGLDGTTEFFVKNGIQPELVLFESFFRTFPIFDNSYENNFLHVYKKASKYRSDIDLGEILMKALDKCVDKEKNPSKYYVEYDDGGESESEEESKNENVNSESEQESENDE